MWTNDPENDFLRHDEEQEEKRLKWLENRPICRKCGEPIEDDECIDLSNGDMQEYYVWHTTCLRQALMYGKLNMTEGEEIFDSLKDTFERRIA